MSFSEELEGKVRVCDDRASLLSDGFVDYAGALNVAGLSFAYSEDLGDALDAVYVARCVVLWLSAAEGFLYGLVDYLCELSYGEVDDSGVLMYHILFCLFGRLEKVSNLRRPRLAFPISLSRGSTC